MDEYMKKCIRDHRNPLVKVNLPAQKLFFAAKTDDEKAMIGLYQENMKIALEHQRVEKRSGRAQATWLPDSNKAKVTKVVKNIVKYFGVQDKTGIFLHPEEMHFLLETNRLEVTLNNTQLSIEKAYEIVLNCVSLEQYRTYKKLALMGYKLVRGENIDQKKFKKSRKREFEGAGEGIASKKLKECDKVETNVIELNEDGDVTKDFIKNLYKKIRDSMPQECEYENTCSAKPDYCIYKPNSVSSSKVEPDFDLFICKNNELPFKGHCSCKFTHIYAICNDDVTFHAFGNVHVPYI